MGELFQVIGVPFGEGESFTGEIMEVLEFGKLSVASDVSIVGRQRHKKMDQTYDYDEAGDSSQNEHNHSMFHVVFAKHFDFFRTSDFHVDTFRTLGKHEMEGIEIDFAFFPTDFIRVANAPAEGVKHGHHDAAGKDYQPAKEEDIGHTDEYHTCHRPSRAPKGRTVHLMSCVSSR